MQEIGEVIKVRKNLATVRVNRKSACGSCGMCAMKPKDLYVDLLLENSLDAKVLDKVVIDISSGSVAKMSVLAYLLPLLLGLIPLIILFALEVEEWISIVAFFVGIAFGFLILSIVDKTIYRKSKNFPKMISIQREVD